MPTPVTQKASPMLQSSSHRRSLGRRRVAYLTMGSEHSKTRGHRDETVLPRRLPGNTCNNSSSTETSGKRLLTKGRIAGGFFMRKKLA